MQAARSSARSSARVVTRFTLGAALAVLALLWFLPAGGAATAARTAPGACSVPAGAARVANVAGILVWRQSVPTPASVRRSLGAPARYPLYSGCASGHQPQVLFRDYLNDAVVVRVAGDYVGLLDRGGMESLYLSDLLTGRMTSTASFTPSVQDNGGSEANEPGPLLSWRVTASGWLVYLDTLSDLEGYGTALIALGESGATTLDLAAPGNLTGATRITGVMVKGRTVSWRSSLSGAHRVTLGRAQLPASLPQPLPSACKLVPPSLAAELLGPLSATSPPPPSFPPSGFQPRARSGTDRSSCAYAAAADPTQTLGIAEQRVTPAIVRRQQRAINNAPRDDSTLVLPGITAVLNSMIEFPSSAQEDLRLFVRGVEVDVTTNSSRAAAEIEAAGLAIERALHDALPAASHV